MCRRLFGVRGFTLLLAYTILSCSLFSIAQTAPPLAQQPPPLATTPPRLASNWFGLRLGYVNSAFPFGTMIHFGTKDPYGNGLRISASYQPGATGAAWGLSGDAITPIRTLNGLSPYAGGGGGIYFEGRSFLLDAHGLLGAEYRFEQAQAEQLGIFLEMQLGAALAVGNNISQPAIPTIGVLLGFNIYF